MKSDLLCLRNFPESSGHPAAFQKTFEQVSSRKVGELPAVSIPHLLLVVDIYQPRTGLAQITELPNHMWKCSEGQEL